MSATSTVSTLATTSPAGAVSQAALPVDQPHGTPEAIRSAYARAYERAAAAKLVAYKNDDHSYDVPSVSTPGDVHTVTIIGRRWYDLRCTCKGANHVACTHRAVVVHAIKYHVHAIRPVRQSAAYREAMAELVLGGNPFA